jgi:hypothetical protein
MISYSLSKVCKTSTIAVASELKALAVKFALYFMILFRQQGKKITLYTPLLPCAGLGCSPSGGARRPPHPTSRTERGEAARALQSANNIDGCDGVNRPDVDASPPPTNYSPELPLTGAPPKSPSPPRPR